MRNLYLLIFVVSCGYKTTTLPDGVSVRNLPGQTSRVDFATVSAQIFGPSCVRCHGSSGGVNLSTYAGAKAALGRIAGAVNSGAMPPGSPLSQSLKNLLNAWITAGGPETISAGGGTTPTPIPTPEPGPPQLDFTSVKARVFQPSCIGCHGSAGGINLSTYASVKRSITRIKSVVNANRMPPSSPLPSAEKNLLNLWIDAGAPELAGGTTTGGGTNEDDCEDDDRLMGAGLVMKIADEWVFDLEKELIRRKHNGCDDDR